MHCLSEVNNAVDSGLLLLAPSTIDAGDAIHYRSDSIGFICCAFFANLFV